MKTLFSICHWEHACELLREPGTFRCKLICHTASRCTSFLFSAKTLLLILNILEGIFSLSTIFMSQADLPRDAPVHCLHEVCQACSEALLFTILITDWECPKVSLSFEHVLCELNMSKNVSAIFPSWTLTLNWACSGMNAPLKCFLILISIKFPNKTPKCFFLEEEITKITLEITTMFSLPIAFLHSCVLTGLV